MIKNKEQKNKQFPIIGHTFARLFGPNKKFIESYVHEGQIMADLGSGPRYNTLHFVKILGPNGKVYAVDSEQKCIKSLEKKAKKRF